MPAGASRPSRPLGARGPRPVAALPERTRGEAGAQRQRPAGPPCLRCLCVPAASAARRDRVGAAVRPAAARGAGGAGRVAGTARATGARAGRFRRCLGAGGRAPGGPSRSGGALPPVRDFSVLGGSPPAVFRLSRTRRRRRLRSPFSSAFSRACLPSPGDCAANDCGPPPVRREPCELRPACSPPLTLGGGACLRSRSRRGRAGSDVPVRSGPPSPPGASPSPGPAAVERLVIRALWASPLRELAAPSLWPGRSSRPIADQREDDERAGERRGGGASRRGSRAAPCQALAAQDIGRSATTNAAGPERLASARRSTCRAVATTSKRPRRSSIRRATRSSEGGSERRAARATTRTTAARPRPPTPSRSVRARRAPPAPAPRPRPPARNGAPR